MSHLLSISALHAAAPGVLDVVFGPDGDFEGVPPWRPPLWGHLPAEFKRQARYHQMATLSVCVVSEMPRPLVRLSSGNTAPIRDAALDCRIPSVAARLAGLCARALGCRPDGAALVARLVPYKVWVLTSEYGAVATWGEHGHPHHHVGMIPAVTPGDFHTEPANFLAALTLTLAPRIAALGGNRV